ncbi:MAG: DUF5522 domain-containing protein [Pyrinomonadaceae bacterium]
MKEINEKTAKPENKKDKFVEGIDFYFENGFMVLTGHFLKKRGYCCGNGCRHCPYSEKSPMKA